MNRAQLARVAVALLLTLGAPSCGDDGGSNTDDDTVPADTSTDDGGTDTTTSPIDTRQADTAPQVRHPLTNGSSVTFGHVVDGDTLDVFVGSPDPTRYDVRLKGLAAPECNKQAVNYRYTCVSDDEYYGLQSRDELLSFVQGKTGILTCDDVSVGAQCPLDTYDRVLGYLQINGRDAATEMAFRGAAFSYTSFWATKRADICSAEYDARDGHRGMWALGTVDAVLSRMSQQTRNWYYDHHDQRCDDALGI